MLRNCSARLRREHSAERFISPEAIKKIINRNRLQAISFYKFADFISSVQSAKSVVLSVIECAFCIGKIAGRIPHLNKHVKHFYRW